MHLLDTNILTAFHKGNPKITAALQALDEPQIATTIGCSTPNPYLEKQNISSQKFKSSLSIKLPPPISTNSNNNPHSANLVDPIY